MKEAAAAAVGDHRTASRYGAMVTSAWRELRGGGPSGMVRLLALLDDAQPEVRARAAAHALEFAPARGMEILTDLARMGGPVGQTAQAALAGWRNGVIGAFAYSA